MRALAPATFLMLVVACRAPSRAHDTSSEEAASTLELAPEDAGDDGARAAAERQKRLDEARAAYRAGTWTGGEIYAAAVRASVLNVPAWPEETDGGVPPPDASVYRLGYLRHGSHAAVFPEPIVNDDCLEGWYELLDGGFVCGKYASMDARAPAVRFAANPPNLASAMPYRYGFSLANDTPVYRRVLSLTDREKYEPWLLPPDPTADAGAPAGASDDAENPYEEAPEGNAKNKRAAKDAGVVKLGDLRGHGVLARKMMKGFYVALDRDFTAAKAHWWRTAEGFAIPYDRLALQSWTPDFHGSWVKPAEASAADAGEAEAEGDGEAALVRTEGAARYTRTDKGRMAFAGPLAKWTALELAGEPIKVDGVLFSGTTSGYFVRLADLMLATPEPPADLAEDEKWIDVDLERQMLVAYEGVHPVFATRVSSGRRRPWDPEHDHPTPTGAFRIYEKHVSTTMDGDVASDGPYSIEDVPWVMYFDGSYALHGAFWHNLFGTTRSHGCINLSPADARELFFWTEPALPKGWHGVFQTADKPGTRVVVHEPPPPKKARP